jgi:GNAT superfamily N-acetyltransferase
MALTCCPNAFAVEPFMLPFRRWLRDASAMTEPQRAIVAADVGLCGLGRVLSREEFLAPPPAGRWSGYPPARSAVSRPRAWSEHLPAQLLDDLQEWNDAWDCDGRPDVHALEERGRALAIRVQEQLGSGWEVLYTKHGRVHRVSPPGSWPWDSWRQELLGYPPRRSEPE